MWEPDQSQAARRADIKKGREIRRGNIVVVRDKPLMRSCDLVGRKGEVEIAYKSRTGQHKVRMYSGRNRIAYLYTDDFDVIGMVERTK